MPEYKLVHSDDILYKVKVNPPGETREITFYILIDSLELLDVLKAVDDYFNKDVDRKNEDITEINSIEYICIDVLMSEA